MKFISDDRNFGEAVPFGYGFCYRDMRRRSCIYYPIPFNFIIKIGMIIFRFFEKGLTGKYEEELNETKKNSYAEGYADGLKDSREILQGRL